MNFLNYFNQKSAGMVLLKNIEISKHLKYHIENNLSLSESVFRIYSDAFFSLLDEVRNLYKEDAIAVNDEDAEMIESDLGSSGLYNGKQVFLDAPVYLEEDIIAEEKIKSKKQGNRRLGSPFRTPGGPKKFAVYVRGKNGNVKKVTFGDPNMKVRNNSPARAKSFRARHKCSQKKDRTTAGYWSCRVGSHSKQLGLKSSRVW